MPVVSGFDEAVALWRDQPHPPGSSITSLDELHADLALADLWVAASVIPFVDRGVYEPARIDVIGTLVELQERADVFRQAEEPERSLALAYRDYAALLVRVYEGFLEQSPRHV